MVSVKKKKKKNASVRRLYSITLIPHYLLTYLLISSEICSYTRTTVLTAMSRFSRSIGTQWPAKSPHLQVSPVKLLQIALWVAFLHDVEPIASKH